MDPLELFEVCIDASMPLVYRQCNDKIAIILIISCNQSGNSKPGQSVNIVSNCEVQQILM